MCFPFRVENIWFGKIQQTSISSTSYKAAGAWPPTGQWLVVGKKWEAGVFKEEMSLETTSDMYQYIGVRLHVYSIGGVWRQRLGWDIFIFEAACRGGGCLIQNEKGRKLIPNGTQTVTAKATQLRYIQYIHQTNIFLCAGQVAKRGRVRLGKTREEKRRRSSIGGGGATILEHQHRWKSFVFQREDWPTFSFSSAAVPSYGTETLTVAAAQMWGFCFVFTIFLYLMD